MRVDDDNYATRGVVVPLSKTKVFLVIFGSGLFVGSGVWLWCIAETQVGYNPLFVKGVALTSVCFFALCGFYAVAKLFDAQPGLTIDAEGIIDNSSAGSVGRILWADVTALRVAEIAGQRLLVIEVVDAQKYVERGGFLKRKLNAGSRSMTGSPINISSNSLGLNFEELLRVMTEAFERYKGAGRANGCS